MKTSGRYENPLCSSSGLPQLACSPGICKLITVLIPFLHIHTHTQRDREHFISLILSEHSQIDVENCWPQSFIYLLNWSIMLYFSMISVEGLDMARRWSVILQQQWSVCYIAATFLSLPNRTSKRHSNWKHQTQTENSGKLTTEAQRLPTRMSRGP